VGFLLDDDGPLVDSATGTDVTNAQGHEIATAQLPAPCPFRGAFETFLAILGTSERYCEGYSDTDSALLFLTYAIKVFDSTQM
jgi:hypothetical protein